MTYAECAGSPSVAHIKMTLKGRSSVFGRILQVYIKLHTVLYVSMKYHSGKAWQEKHMLMFKKIRKIDLIE